RGGNRSRGQSGIGRRVAVKPLVFNGRELFFVFDTGRFALKVQSCRYSVLQLVTKTGLNLLHSRQLLNSRDSVTLRLVLTILPAVNSPESNPKPPGNFHLRE